MVVDVPTDIDQQIVEYVRSVSPHIRVHTTRDLGVGRQYLFEYRVGVQCVITDGLLIFDDGAAIQHVIPSTIHQLVTAIQEHAREMASVHDVDQSATIMGISKNGTPISCRLVLQPTVERDCVYIHPDTYMQLLYSNSLSQRDLPFILELQPGTEQQRVNANITLATALLLPGDDE